MRKGFQITFILLGFAIAGYVAGHYWIQKKGENSRDFLVSVICERQAVQEYSQVKQSKIEGTQKMKRYFEIYDGLVPRMSDSGTSESYLNFVARTEPTTVLAFTNWVMQGVDETCKEGTLTREDVQDFIITMLYAAGSQSELPGGGARNLASEESTSSD